MSKACLGRDLHAQLIHLIAVNIGSKSLSTMGAAIFVAVTVSVSRRASRAATKVTNAHQMEHVHNRVPAVLVAVLALAKISQGVQVFLHPFLNQLKEGGTS